MMNREQLIAALRKRQGKRAQQDLAAELGISPSYLSDIYKGKREPGEQVLSKLGLERQVGYLPRKTA